MPLQRPRLVAARTIFFRYHPEMSAARRIFLRRQRTKINALHRPSHGRIARRNNLDPSAPPPLLGKTKTTHPQLTDSSEPNPVDSRERCRAALETGSISPHVALLIQAGLASRTAAQMALDDFPGDFTDYDGMRAWLDNPELVAMPTETWPTESTARVWMDFVSQQRASFVTRWRRIRFDVPINQELGYAVDVSGPHEPRAWGNLTNRPFRLTNLDIRLLCPPCKQ